MQTIQRTPRKMRPARRRERQDEHPQTWFGDADLKRAKDYAEHTRKTGTLPATEQEN